VDENEEFEFRLRAEQEAAATPKTPVVPASTKPATPSLGERMSAHYDRTMSANPLTGAAELGLSGVTGAASKIASGYAGLGALLGRALGLTEADPADTVRGVQEAGTYQPRSDAAAIIGKGVNAAASVFDPVAEAVENSDNPAVSTLVPAAAEAVTEVVPMAAAAKPLAAAAKAGKAARTVEGAARPSPNDPVAAMRAAGYKLRPSDVQAVKPGEKVPGLRREGLQEPAQLRKDFTRHNQAVSTKLANEEIGTKNLSAGEFERVRQPHFKVYDDVEKAVGANPGREFKTAREAALARTGFKPDAKPTTTQIIAALRKQERKRARSDDVATNKEGQLDRDAADALEGALEKQLTDYGDEKLFKDYQDSRRSLARIHDVETATRGQQIDAQYLRRIDQRDKGRMSGRLKLIADSADTAKNVVRHSQGATGRGNSVKADSMVGAIKNAVKGAVARIPGMDVTKEGFQAKNFGRQATEAERGTFSDYGKRPEKAQPVTKPAPQLGAGDVEFSGQGGVTPPLANDLAGDLELLPDPVPGAQVLPERPPMMTADAPPPITGDIDFTPGPPVGLDDLAGDLDLMSPMLRDPDSLDWVPPVVGDAGDLASALGLPDDLVAQLGLAVDTPQPSLMTPVADPVPFGPRVQLEAPPGRVGKAPSQKKPGKPKK
jgi:hypothetical protein